MGSDEQHNTTMETVLGHSSGEFISSSCVMPIAKLAGGGASNPAQIMGASITYMRRYQYAAIIGLAQDDTDGVPKAKEVKIELLSAKQLATIRSMLNDITTEGVVCGQIGVNKLEEMHAATFNDCITWIKGEG